VKTEVHQAANFARMQVLRRQQDCLPFNPACTAYSLAIPALQTTAPGSWEEL